LGRIRYAGERTPGVWIWHVQVHLTGGLPLGTALDLDTAKADFKVAWLALKAKVTPEKLDAAFRSMHIDG
jgi:hypothetical protein